MSRLTTWPIRVALLPGEALDSWLETCAQRMDALLGEVLIAAGLLADPQISRRQELPPNYTIYLTNAEASRLSQTSGVPVAQLHAMTLRAYEGQAVRFDPDKRAVARAALWGKGEGSRYCPQCLHERGGRWLLRWRLSWTFACTHHRILLADRCPECGQETRLHRPRRAAFSPFPPPRCCGTRIAGDNCRHDLTTTRPVRLNSRHPLLRAQSWIDSLLNRVEMGSVHDGPVPRDAFEELQILASWILRRGRPEDFTGFGAHVEAALQTYQHTKPDNRHFPPVDAAVTGAALTRAIAIHSGNPEAALTALQDLLAREPDWSKTVIPAALNRHANRMSPRLQGLILRARDHDLSHIHRLRYRTCTATPRIPTGDLTARARHVPQLLWPGWTIRLTPRGIGADLVRAALSAALLLPGSRATALTAAITALDPNSRHRARGHLLGHVINKTGGDSLLTAICAIADYLDQHGAPIDYARRRCVIRGDLLPEQVWRQICRHTGTPDGQRLYQAARGWLYQHLTGNSLDTAAEPFTVDDPHDRLRCANLPLELSQPVFQALHEHAADYLAGKGIHEPTTWEPPATCTAALGLPGRDPADIDIAALHRLVADQHLPASATAAALGTTIEHVRHALEQHPLPARPRHRTATPAQRRAHTLLTPNFLGRATAAGTSIRAIARQTGLPRPLVTQYLRTFSS